MASKCWSFLFVSGLQRPSSPGLCGHFALADLSARVLRSGPLTWDQALDHTAVIVASFSLTLPDLCSSPVLLGGTIGPLLAQSVASLLRDRGAVEGDVRRLSPEAVQAAMSPFPWKH